MSKYGYAMLHIGYAMERWLCHATPDFSRAPKAEHRSCDFAWPEPKGQRNAGDLNEMKSPPHKPPVLEGVRGGFGMKLENRQLVAAIASVLSPSSRIDIGQKMHRRLRKDMSI